MSKTPNEVVVKRLVVWPAYDYSTDGATPRFLFPYDPDRPEIPLILKLGAVDDKEMMIPGANFQIEIASTQAETGPAVSTFAVQAGDKFAPFRIPADFVPNLRQFVMSVSVSVTPDANDFGETVYVDFAAYEKPRASEEAGEDQLLLEIELGARQAQMLEMITRLNASVADQVQTSSGALSALQEMLTASREELVTTRAGEEAHRQALLSVNQDLTNTIRMILTSFEEFSTGQQGLIANLETKRQVEWRNGRDAAETRNRQFSEIIDRQAEVLADHITKLVGLTKGVSQLDATVQQMVDKTGVLPKVCINLQNASDELKRIAAYIKALEGLAEQVAAALGPVLGEAVRPLKEKLVSQGKSLTAVQTRLDAIEASQQAGLRALEEIKSLHKMAGMPSVPSPEETPMAVRTDADLAWNWVWIGGILILTIGLAIAVLMH
jgi:hypothetical protein